MFFFCVFFLGNLHLQNITTEDEGTYLCKAGNGLNTLMLDGLKAMMLEISGLIRNLSLGKHYTVITQLTLAISNSKG